MCLVGRFSDVDLPTSPHCGNVLSEQNMASLKDFIHHNKLKKLALGGTLPHRAIVHAHALVCTSHMHLFGPCDAMLGHWHATCTQQSKIHAYTYVHIKGGQRMHMAS